MNSDLSKIIGKRINTLLAEQDKKQKELAAFLGVQDNTISYFVSGRRTPNTEQLAKIADFFNVSTDYLLGRTETKTTDKDVQFVCEYTRLSEESIKALHEGEDYNPLPIAANFFLEDCASSMNADLVSLFMCFRDYRTNWQYMNYCVEEMSNYLPDWKMRIENTQEALDRSLNNKDFLNEQTVNEMRELSNSYNHYKLQRDVQKLRLQESIFDMLNAYCRDCLEEEQENKMDFEDFIMLFLSLENNHFNTQQKDGEPHGNDQ